MALAERPSGAQWPAGGFARTAGRAWLAARLGGAERRRPRACGSFRDAPEWAIDPRVEAILDSCAKPWATLGDNMAAAAAAKLLHDDGLDPGAIRRVRV